MSWVIINAYVLEDDHVTCISIYIFSNAIIRHVNTYTVRLMLLLTYDLMKYEMKMKQTISVNRRSNMRTKRSSCINTSSLQFYKLYDQAQIHQSRAAPSQPRMSNW
jgi:hypothetical protein